LAEADKVTFSGTAVCDGCTGTLILRVTTPPDPGGSAADSGFITQAVLAEAGPFSILVPKGDSSVTLELLVDADNSGGPSQGEGFAALELAGKLIPNEDRAELSLNATARDPDNKPPE
jgi:hypothetical protein